MNKRSINTGSSLIKLLMQTVLVCLFLCSGIFAQPVSLKKTYKNGDIAIVNRSFTAEIFISEIDAKVVKIAAKDLAADIERITGKLPVVSTKTKTSNSAILIGTLGSSPLIESLIRKGSVDVSRIRGKRESFIIATIANPLPGVRNGLVIIGSDRCGTAFGIYELSQRIGVSPWYWWADVNPEIKKNLFISKGTFVSKEPSVKYRGIFLNDEDWGLQPWAAKTFEPETGDIGPKTYAKIFELLLRLKANTLWPAMHEVTRPFNSITASRQVADDYGIVMGSSHAEPMLRNNVGEWKGNKDDYNFVTNPQGVTDYWDKRVKENGAFENIYTIGMRGIHDSPILGTKSQAERIPLLEQIFSVQRGLLAKYVRPDVENIPQIFCPYKEVLTDYRAGLKVPDDVTIVFPDDNFGYIRQFPSIEEQKRKGGFGVYYHISYLGRPLSYLWLNSTPPSLIWQEMSKAYENGMRQFWIVNVGDIKPAEIGMEFFLSMAYDTDRWTLQTQYDYLREWTNREFGSEHSVEIAEILDQYYRLGFQRKPEQLQWHLPTEPQRTSDLTNTEKLNRLDEYAALR
ncbi:MAG TPA: glycosyl hydrolase 115 family protein, partial [Pyrinomonadaceae bacterium]|nr:glycosyl hydrolase 115 family protein [Pyrinomonadaceae bacterium]